MAHLHRWFGLMVTLSASKLKVLKDCAWLYWTKYGQWKLPEITSDGAKRGQVVHSLFECLLNPRHRHHYDKILKEGKIRTLPIIHRFVRRKMSKEGIITEYDHKNVHNFDLIEQMILSGLRFDFFCEEGQIEQAETEFTYTSEKGYAIRGFIDKLAVFGERLHIYDYKSSEKAFQGDELENNFQAMIYSLYAQRVRKMDSIVNFIFLRYPDEPLREVHFDLETLEGFEQYLVEVTKYLENFDLSDAYSGFAADKPYPAKDKGFTGPLLCGYGKYPGHSKKTGEEYWTCPMKWPFDYYAVLNKETRKVIRTSFNKNELKSDETSFIEKRRYNGCPAWSLNLWYSNLKDAI